MTHWCDRPEGGNRFWLVLIRWIILNLGRRCAQYGMWPTTLYFFCVRGVERRASRRWLSRVNAPQQGYIGVLIHIYTFAITIVDRVLLLSGREHELILDIDGVDALVATLRRGQGCLLLGSHLGSFEAIRMFSRRAPPECQQLKVVMDINQNSLITRVLEDLNPSIRDTVIDARQPGPQIVLDVAETLGQGGMVAMLADRIDYNESCIAVDFLGESASLPVAPLAIASALEAPVFMVFGLYAGRRRYRLVFEALHPPTVTPMSRQEKRRRLQQWVTAYAQRLEYYARQYPYNWFNFYDFWDSGRTDNAQSGKSRH